MAKTVYDFYADPGHGWLKVKKKELYDLGITDKITKCSYIRGTDVYLEEDLDAQTFIDAKKTMEDIEVRLRYHHSDRTSRIRNYTHYA
jgi:hypothetical protein